MHRPTRLKMADLNPHLTCVLCDGYFVDATTVVECLHSFCRACIVKYLETNKYCPVCDVQVHKTKPLLSLRSDQTLQDIAYKLVPSLYPNEMKRRRDFYVDYPDKAARCDSEERGEGTNQRFIYTPEETISLSLEYGNGSKQNATTDRASESPDEIDKDAPKVRFLLCPAAITVSHLKKFLSAKYNVPSTFKVEITYNGDLLNETYTLMDIAYIYAWRRCGPMRFCYQINKMRTTTKRRNPASPVKCIAASDAAQVDSEVKPKKIPALSAIASSGSVEKQEALATEVKKDEKADTESRTPSSICKELKPMPALSNSPDVNQLAANIRNDFSNQRVDGTILPNATKILPEIPKGLSDPVATMACTFPMTTLPMLSNGMATLPVTTLPVTQAMGPSFIAAMPTPPTAKKPQSKRSRARPKKLVQRTLAKLAPYPSSCSSSPVPSLAMQNHFSSSPVTCFSAPPATLSTPPVNCLGAVSVSYLPTPTVNCYGPGNMNGTASFKMNNLITSTVTASVPTTVTMMSMTNPMTQTAPHQVANQSFCSKPPSNIPTTASIFASTAGPVPTSCTLTSSTSLQIGTTALSSSVPGRFLGKGGPPSSMASKAPTTVMQSLALKPVSSSSSLAQVSNKVSTNVATSLNQLQQAPAVPYKSLPLSVAAPLPVISTDISLQKNQYLLTPSTTTNKSPSAVISTSSPLTSMSFAVQNLVPNLTNGPSHKTTKTSDLKFQPTPKPTEPLIININTLPPTDNSAPKVDHNDTTNKSDDKQAILPFTKDAIVTSPLATEKNVAINVPFKEVKSSITAEFSDNDDGCQPDLVVDEQKMDTSDNEDDADDDALRRKINAIAEKEDEVDIETDSGRASDVSNQARSSGDDDIGSPMPAACTTDSERSVASLTTTAVVSNPTVTTATSISISKQEDTPQFPKANGIDRIINNLHRNHERKDTIGALDLSTSFRKSGAGENTSRPRSRPVANPPVLDIKHRQQTCLSAPTKQHTACVPAPKHPTSSNFLVAPLSATARHGMLPVTSSPSSVNKLAPLTVPHFNPTPVMSTTLAKSPITPTVSHILCRTPPMINSNSFRSQPCKRPSFAASRQTKSSPTSCQRKSISDNTSSFISTSDPVSPRHINSSLSPSSTPAHHQRLSPSFGSPVKNADRSPTDSHLKLLNSPSVPSTSASTYKLSRPPIPIYKKSDSYKNSHHNRFKGSSNLTVINHDPNGYGQRIVIKKVDPRPNSYSNHHHR